MTLTDRAKELAREALSGIDYSDNDFEYVERALLQFGEIVAKSCCDHNGLYGCSICNALATELRRAASGDQPAKAGDAK